MRTGTACVRLALLLAILAAPTLGASPPVPSEVITGDGRTGLALGTVDHFPALQLEREFTAAGFGADEQYLLRSHPKGLYAVGASETAVEHAAWDLLYRLGYRQFFPGPTWEVVPRCEELGIAVNAKEKPDYAYRMRKTMLVHTKSLCRDLPARDKAVQVPANAVWSVPEGKNPWKTSDPWTRAELDGLLTRGIAENKTVATRPVRFSRELVPVDRTQFPEVPVLDDSQRGRGQQVFYTWFKSAPATLDLKVTGGLIAHYRDRGNVRIDLFALAGSKEQLVDQQATVPPDGKQHSVTLRSDRPGLHKLVLNDGSDMTEVLRPACTPRTVEVSLDAAAPHAGRRSGYFYVPRGTKVVVGYAARDARAQLKDADGKVALRFADLDGPDYFSVPVPPGQDGRFWSLHGAPGAVVLLTVPPYIARHPTEMLLPKEVVDRVSSGGSGR